MISNRTYTDEVGSIIAFFIGALAGFGVALASRRFGDLRNRLKAFFGRDPMKVPIVTRTFSTLDLANLQRAIELVTHERGVKLTSIGYASAFSGFHNDLRSLLNSSFGSQTIVGPVQYRSVEIGPGESMQCVENGIHLIHGPTRIAAHVRTDMMKGSLELEVMASNEAAEAFLQDVAHAIARSNVYQGKVLSLSCADRREGVSVHFHAFPVIRREEIILPERLLDLLERNTIRFFAHADRLRGVGRSTKRGLLLYGKPGTGKTFTAKWLAHAIPGLTVVVLSGEQLGLIRQGCQLARMLAPSLVILEDVDLVATHRDENRDPSSHVTLHQILNELDGMPDNTDVMFLLTTNRPDVLEPALAARPGRIDQAIEYPLPDEDCRRRLIELYGRGLNLRLESPETVVGRTEGASPAFIQELLRKAALLAADRRPNEDLEVRDQDIRDALQELLFDGGDLTRKLLGFTGESVEALRLG